MEKCIGGNMEFVKYQKIRRLGTSDTQGILFGTVYVFYKIDGTNASVWLKNDEIKAGSRNRELSVESDNGGFYNKIKDDENVRRLLKSHSDLRLFGEFLIPHTLRTYNDDAWRQFYVFDVMDEDGKYLSYDEYKPLLEEYDIKYVPPIAVLENPTLEQIHELLQKTGDFLVSEGFGEGLVCKNYEYQNTRGDIIWGKVINDEFKGTRFANNGIKEVPKRSPIEERIVEDFCTNAFIEKEYAKIVVASEGWHQKFIPRLLHTVYHELVTEEIWNILKKYKNPIINFTFLNHLVINKVKKVKMDLF